uniref:semaphorin-7A-like isoform X1 n=1 Tax=Semicossyphus pulcher TaxID=241346 RepID=UPI0037E6FB81
MCLLLLSVYILFPSLCGLTEANTAHLPRMIIPDTDTSMMRIRLPGDHPSAQILLEGKPDTVTVFGQNHLISLNFQDPQQVTPQQRKVSWEDCIGRGSSQKDCNYNITVVHKRKDADLVFVCGTNGRETFCCDMNVSRQFPMCSTTRKVKGIQQSIREFTIKEGEASALVESEADEDLYMTYSGSQMFVGIHKFGTKSVGPANHNKEQHFVGLVPIRQPDNPLQDKVFGFYREKNQDSGLYSGMWLPFVTQVCMADIGGPKTQMQFTWTSQMNARLFCGDPDSRQHFSELVDVAAVYADRWQDTKVYGLFRNEWGMSAVCVYTIHDINKVFTNSPFKGYSTGAQRERPRQCVRDSTAIPLSVLKKIEENSEMEDWVRPVDDSDPILFNRHRYTHIYVDPSPNQGNTPHPVLFLSLHNGGIHKVMQNQMETFVIAEYRPFNHGTHLLSLTLQPSTRKLYVNSRNELVQLDVANCAQYGDRCEDCVLARDPYCGWKNSSCVPQTPKALQDVAQVNPAICQMVHNTERVGKHLGMSVSDNDKGCIPLHSESKYFLQCSVSSLHAEYTWHHPEGSTSCSSKEQQCLLLIDSMGPKQDGNYKCVSEEKGYSKVVAEYRLRLESRAAGHSSSLLVWVCLMAALLVLSK